jgi:hypothetical protein
MKKKYYGGIKKGTRYVRWVSMALLWDRILYITVPSKRVISSLMYYFITVENKNFEAL